MDKQYLVAVAQLPPAASLDRTEAVTRRIAEIALKQPGVAHAVEFAGMSVNGFTQSSSASLIFFPLDDFSQRTSKALSGPAIAAALNQKMASIQDAFVIVVTPPPVIGLGTLGGFKLQVEDRADAGPQALFAALSEALGKAYQNPALGGAFSTYQINVPQLDVDVDRVKAKILDQTLPRGMSYEWTDLAYQQLVSGNTGLLVFPLCVLFVFLVLAAQYESLSLPLAIILIVPMCLLPAVTALKLDHGDNNIFTQIGLLVLVGLACKNAILIVEFAKHLQEEHGRDAGTAVLEAAHLRLRPILMTSMAFVMGVVPLTLATGAGAEVRHALGVTVFAGMIGVTGFGLLLTPVFYVFVRRASRHVEADAARHTDADSPGHLPAPEPLHD